MDISELNSRFVEYKEASSSKIPKIRSKAASIKQEIKDTFFNSKTTKEFVMRGEIPSQRAFLE